MTNSLLLATLETTSLDGLPLIGEEVMSPRPARAKRQTLDNGKGPKRLQPSGPGQRGPLPSLSERNLAWPGSAVNNYASLASIA